LDLRKVPKKKVIKQIMLMLKKSYPGTYDVLVEQRNHYMADRLKQLMQIYPDKKIVAIVGAGHEEGIMELVRKDRISFSYTVSS